jgi:hypothetical protein
MVYYFIRILIHRPAACFGAANVANPSVLVLSDSSKHMIQILQLLDERRLSLSISIQRRELACLAGLGLLWQNMDLNRDSKLVKESQKLLSVVIDQLECESPAAAAEFSHLSSMLTGVEGDQLQSPSGRSQHEPSPKSHSRKKPLQALRSRLSLSGASERPMKTETLSRRNTVTNASPLAPQRQLDPCQPVDGSLPTAAQQQSSEKRRSLDYTADSNLDYYSLQPENMRAMSCNDLSKTALSTADWEFILSDMDRGHTNIFNGIYGGQEGGEDQGPFPSLAPSYPQSTSYLMSRPDSQGLSPEAWSASSADLPPGHGAGPQSVQSYSEDSRASTEDLIGTHDLSLQHSGNVGMVDPLKGIMIPAADDDFTDLGLYDGWDQPLVA